jgi:hypothetical protein
MASDSDTFFVGDSEVENFVKTYQNDERKDQVKNHEVSLNILLSSTSAADQPKFNEFVMLAIYAQPLHF